MEAVAMTSVTTSVSTIVVTLRANMAIPMTTTNLRATTTLETIMAAPMVTINLEAIVTLGAITPTPMRTMATMMKTTIVVTPEVTVVTVRYCLDDIYGFC